MLFGALSPKCQALCVIQASQRLYSFASPVSPLKARRPVDSNDHLNMASTLGPSGFPLI